MEFVKFYEEFFVAHPTSIENYRVRSTQLREHFITQKRSLTILHRDGGIYLLRPINERLRDVEPGRLPRYGVYRSDAQEA